MDIESLNSNINNLQNNVSQNQALDKSSSVKAINKEDDALLIEISELLKGKRSDLAVTLEESNDALAVTKIMQNSLEKQTSILKDVKELVEDTKEYKDLSLDKATSIKNEIRENFSKFEENSKNLTFKYENLYQSKYEEKNITITTGDETYLVEKLDLQDIKNDIYSNFGQIGNFEDTTNLENSLDNSINKLEELSSKFSNIESEVTDNARSSITEQFKSYNENSKLREKDFGKEVSDFSKTNVSANSGYLAASQANIVQAQAVRLVTG